MRLSLEKLKPLKETLAMQGGTLVQQVTRRFGAFHLWVFCTLAIILAAASLVSSLLLDGRTYSRKAIERGQRVVYHLAGGEIDGTPRHTKRASEPVEPVIGQGGATINETFDGREGLAAAPYDAITEQTDKGLIPTAGRDGTLAWKYYSRPFTPKQQRPIVAVLFTNLGLSKPLTEEVLNLPHDLTLSFSPYASDAKNWARKARNTGFESLIDLPMEPSNFPLSDPGPYGLLNSLDSAEISNRMHWTMSRYPGFVGVLASPDEKMTPNLSSMRSILTELTARGVLFIYRKTDQNAELANLIRTQKLLALPADAVIDEELTTAAVTKQLDALAETAKKQGYAIGIAHSYPTTTKALTLWMEKLQEKGVDLAPVSAVAKQAFP